MYINRGLLQLRVMSKENENQLNESNVVIVVVVVAA